MDSFTDGWALWLLSAAAAMALMYVLSGARTVRDRAGFADKGLHARLGLGGDDTRRALRGAMCVLAAVAAVLAIARPTGGIAEEERSAGGMDVIVVLDLSLSMAAEDESGPRLDSAKDALRELVAAAPNNRYGLVTFTGEAVVICPLTHDQGAFLTILDTETISPVNPSGSAVGDGIAAALVRFKPEKDIPRAVLLVSDGENTSGIDPVAAASGAKEAGLKVYVLGVGSAKGAKVPYGRDVFGNKTYKYDRRGRLVISRLDEKTLRGVAEAGGGKYFHASDRNVTEALRLNLSEKSSKPVKTGMKKRREFGPALSFVAACLLTLALAI